MWQVRLYRNEESEWLRYSINHPISDLIDAILQFLKFDSSEVGGTYKIPIDISQAISFGIQAQNETAGAVQALLFTRILFLNNTDPSWIKEIMLPLLDTTKESAEASWEGLSYQRNMTASLWEELEPHFNDLLRSELRLAKRSTEYLAQLCALACFSYYENPLLNSFITTCLDYFQAEESSFFIRALDYRFTRNPEESMTAIWNSWLSDLLDLIFDVHSSRLRNLQSQWIGTLFHWLATAPSLAVTIGEKVLKLHLADIVQGEPILMWLNESKVDQNKNGLFADLLIFILKNAELDQYDESTVSQLTQRISKESLGEGRLPVLKEALTAKHFLSTVEILE